MWPLEEYFKKQMTDYNMEETNYPENLIFYVNQEHLTIQKNKKMDRGNYFFVEQIIQASNPPENTDTYVCKENEVKLFRPSHDVPTGEFLGLYETVGFIVVRADEDEFFFNCEFDKEKFKIICSQYRRRIPNSFGGTLFSRHGPMIDSGELETKSGHSELFFLLPSITDRLQQIKKHTNNVSVSRTDLTQEDFSQWLELCQKFEPHHLDLSGEMKKLMTDCVVRTSKHILWFQIPV